MAEPASALVALSSAVQLIAACLEVSTFLHSIPVNYKESLAILRSIEVEVGIFAAAVGHVREWLEKITEQGPKTDDSRIQGVKNALNQFNWSMKDLQKTLAKIGYKSDSIGAWSKRWIKTKFVFQEDTLKAHLGELRQQAALIQFTLTALQLHTSVAETKVTFESIAIRAKTIRRSCAIKEVKLPDEIEYQRAEVTTGHHLSSKQDSPPRSAARLMTSKESQTASSKDLSPHKQSSMAPNPVKPAYPGQQTYRAPRRAQVDEPEATSASSSVSNTSSTLNQLPPGASSQTTQARSQRQQSIDRSPMLPSNPILGSNRPERDTVRPPVELLGSVPVIADDQRPTVSRVESATSGVSRKPVGPSRSQSNQSVGSYCNTTGGSNAKQFDNIVPLMPHERSPTTSALNTVGNTSADINDPPPPFTLSSNPTPTLAPASEGYGYHSGISDSQQSSMPLTEKSQSGPSYTDVAPDLLRAAREGSAGAVERLLASGADIEAVDQKTGRTALGEASVKGRVGIAQLLLSHRCNLNALDVETMAPLHHAAQNGYDQVATALLDGGALVDIRGTDNVSPLHLAAEAGQVSMVMLLLRRKADVNAKSIGQRGALHAAASHGFGDMCTLLIDNGAHIDDKDLESKTAVQLAAEAGHINLVNHLVSRAGFKATDPSFTVAVFAAIESGNVRMVEEMLDKGASIKKFIKGLKEYSFKPATLAAKSGNLAMLELMIRNKAKIKEKDPSGWTALHYAAYHGHAHIIERLADNEIPTKATTTKKETPLHLAAQASQYTAFSTLLRGKGSSQLTSKDVYGDEPLHAATRSASIEVLNLLFSHKVPLTTPNAFGWTVLHIAVAYGLTTTVSHLLNLGLTTDDRLTVPKTPTTSPKPPSQILFLVHQGYWAEAHLPFPGSKALHLAIEFRRDDIAHLLLSRGAKIDSACGSGWRPLHLAAFTSSPAMVQMLLEKGAYPHAATGMVGGKTPLDIARWRSMRHDDGDLGVKAGEGDKKSVEELLSEAMAETPKREKEAWKAKMFGGEGPEEKEERARAAGVAMGIVGRAEAM